MNYAQFVTEWNKMAKIASKKDWGMFGPLFANNKSYASGMTYKGKPSMHLVDIDVNSIKELEALYNNAQAVVNGELWAISPGKNNMLNLHCVKVVKNKNNPYTIQVEFNSLTN